jgi:Ca2+/H+ antiporter
MKRWIESYLSDAAGNSVVGALLNITFSTLITLSLLSLSLSAYNTLLIRDAAIDAAAKAALPQAPSQQPYLRKLMDDRLPLLASYELEEISNDEVVGFRIRTQLPGLGLISLVPSTTEVLVAKEQIPSR